MNIMRIAGIGIVASSFCTALPVHADTQAEQAAMLDEVRQLRSEVAHIKAAHPDGWLTRQRSVEIRSLVEDVLADADTRASLLDRPIQQVLIESRLVEMNDRFINEIGTTMGIVSPDGQNALGVNGAVQARLLGSFIDSDTQDDNRAGFDVNSRLIIRSLVDGNNFVHVEGRFNDQQDGELELMEAWIGRNFGKEMSIRAGQFTLPFLRESLVDEFNRDVVAGSTVEQMFGAKYGQGVQFAYQSGAFRGSVAISDGINSLNTPALEETTDFAASARIELQVTPQVSEGNQVRLLLRPRIINFTEDENVAVTVGAGGHIQRDETGTPADEVDIYTGTLDVEVATQNIGGFGAFVFRHQDLNNGNEQDMLAWMAQVGVAISPHTTVFARYEGADFDVPGERNMDIGTVGVTTRLNVRDGQTVLLGGLTRVTVDGGVGKVPNLGSIPVLGSLFSDRDGIRDGSDELIIFIRASIITEF
jgi:hypothetical protein